MVDLLLCSQKGLVVLNFQPFENAGLLNLLCDENYELTTSLEL